MLSNKREDIRKFPNKYPLDFTMINQWQEHCFNLKNEKI